MKPCDIYVLEHIPLCHNGDKTWCSSIAAAVMMTRMGFVSNIVFDASHPFLFVIKEADNGIILFIGRFSKPSQ